MEIPISALISMYIADKQSEGLSPRTLEWYKDKLLMFNRHVSNGHEARLPDFNLINVRAFIAELQSRDSRYPNCPIRKQETGKLSTQYIHGHVRTLKAFASWLATEGLTNGNVLEKLKRPKLSQPMIEIFTKDELDKMMAVINPDTVQGGRMLAIVMLLLDTGIRASELTGVTMVNTHLENDTIKVQGKGNKERMVSFGSGTKKALVRYISTWRPTPSHESIDNVFLNNMGDPLSYTALQQALKRLGNNAGVPRIRAHLFRHTFAVRFLVDGGDLMTLRLILGHTDISVTQQYLHLASSFVQVQQRKYSPVDRLGIKPRKKRSA